MSLDNRLGDLIPEHAAATQKVVHGDRVDNVEALANAQARVLFENLTEQRS